MTGEATTGPDTMPERVRPAAVRWVRTHPGLVVALVVPVALFGVPVLFGWSYLDGDNFLQNFPLRVLVGRDLRQGILPLWNPYLFSGTPLLGGFNAGAAYPTTWLTAVLPIFAAWWLTLAAAYDVALAGMYLFLRRQGIAATAATFGACTFALAGYMVAQIVHVDLISGAAWLPWMTLSVHALTEPGEAAPDRRQRWIALLALSVGLSFLSGGVEAIIDSGVLIAVYLIWRLVGLGRRADRRPGEVARAVARVAVGTVGGVALGTAQWLPGLAFTSMSQRSATTYTFFTSGSLSLRLLTLVASPFVLGTNQGEPGPYAGPFNLPEVSSYAGVLALIAACSLFLRRHRSRPEARHWWVWYVIGGLGLLSALGGETPFGHLMYLLPGISTERLLNRNLLLVDFSLAVLLAWWVHLLLGAPGDRQRRAAGRGRGRPAEVVVTCIPLTVITVLCLLLWVDGAQLERALGGQFVVATATRLRVAGLVTALALVAGVATWIALAEGRLPTRRLRRLLSAVLVTDLVLFAAFQVRLPVSEATAQAQGATATTFRSLVGDGRFIIYDPDEFETDQLYALGQTDLNVHSGLSSGQGYTALTDGGYFAATGAHYQEDLDPAQLAGPTWDQLNATTLVSLPGYFVTPAPGRPAADDGDGSLQFPSPIPVEFIQPAPPDTFRLVAGRPRVWYFGGVLTTRSVTVPVRSGASAGLRIGLITPTGGTRWLSPTDVGAARGAAGHTSVRLTLPSPVPAGGLVVEAPGPGTTVATPVADTVEAGAVALDGRMQEGVVPPHWVFTGTLGSFGVFHNGRARGWAWADAPGGGRPPAGTSVTTVAPGQDGTQRVTVVATAPVDLLRSEAWSPGWRASVQRMTPAPGGTPLGPPRPLRVQASGVIQTVSLPGPGTYVVTFTYAATVAVVGVAVSAAAGAILALWAVWAAVVTRRRRRPG